MGVVEQLSYRCTLPLYFFSKRFLTVLLANSPHSPVNGKFTPDQKSVYQGVLDAGECCLRQSSLTLESTSMSELLLRHDSARAIITLLRPSKPTIAIRFLPPHNTPPVIAVERAMKPGVSWVDMHDIATRAVLAALVKASGRRQPRSQDPPRRWIKAFCPQRRPK